MRDRQFAASTRTQSLWGPTSNAMAIAASPDNSLLVSCMALRSSIALSGPGKATGAVEMRLGEMRALLSTMRPPADAVLGPGSAEQAEPPRSAAPGPAQQKTRLAAGRSQRVDSARESGGMGGLEIMSPCKLSYVAGLQNSSKNFVLHQTHAIGRTGR